MSMSSKKSLLPTRTRFGLQLGIANTRRYIACDEIWGRKSSVSFSSTRLVIARNSLIAIQKDMDLHLFRKFWHNEIQRHSQSIIRPTVLLSTVSAVLNEESQTQHIKYFQGYGQYCEPGFPVELPANIEKSILMQPDVVEMRNHIHDFENCHDEASLKTEKLRLRNALVRQRRSELKNYQIQRKRDQNILNRGRKRPIHL